MEFIRKLFRRDGFLRQALPPVLFFLILVGLDWSFRRIYAFTNTGNMGARSTAWVFTLSWACFWTALTCALPTWPRRILMGLVGLVFTILPLVHGGMYLLFGSFFSFADMNYAEVGAKFFSFSYFMGIRKLLLGILGLSLIGVITAACLVQKKKWRPIRLLALVLAALSLGMIWKAHTDLLPDTVNMTWGVNYKPDDPSSVYNEFRNPTKCLNLVGLYQYTARDLYRYMGFENDSESWEELDAYFDSRVEEIAGDTEMTGAFKGKNLVMIMMESMDTWMLTPEYTPNLWALQSESIRFVNHYTPLFLTAGTFNTEFTSQTGLIPSSLQDANAYPGNEFPLSLAHLFRNLGYRANSFHSANPAIYSRGPIHRNLGFEAYHNYADMGMDDYELDSQMTRAFDQMVLDEPFFTYIITYSGHGPYTDEMANISDPHLEAAQALVAASGVTGSEDNMSQYTLAIAHTMEADDFIGGFMDALHASGHDQDTVVLIYGDHYGKYMTDKAFLAQVKGVSANSKEMYRTPCFIWSADQEPREITKFTATADLVPTLVKLFGLDADCRYFVGDDMFGDKGGFAMLPGFEYAAPEGEDHSAETVRRTKASNNTLSSNYFASWNQ